jgi:hypothetical protein
MVIVGQQLPYIKRTLWSSLLSLHEDSTADFVGFRMLLGRNELEGTCSAPSVPVAGPSI